MWVVSQLHHIQQQHQTVPTKRSKVKTREVGEEQESKRCFASTKCRVAATTPPTIETLHQQQHVRPEARESKSSNSLRQATRNTQHQQHLETRNTQHATPTTCLQTRPTGATRWPWVRLPSPNHQTTSQNKKQALQQQCSRCGKQV